MVSSKEHYGTTDHAWVEGVDPDVIPQLKEAKYQYYGQDIYVMIDGAIIASDIIGTEGDTAPTWYVRCGQSREILFRTAGGDTLGIYRPGA